ncbi:MAG TPA: CBS domain-containing protein [Thermoproteales archaeon]|nr:CBS domain-containing protein [Thermoproteales archaeon]
MKLSELKFGRYPPAVIAYPETPINTAIIGMKDHGVRHAPIIDPQNKFLRGMVSAKDLVNFLGGGLKKRIIDEKYGGDAYKALTEEPVYSIKYDPPFVYLHDTLATVVTTMMERDIGALPVLDEENHVVGIISEKHIANLFAETNMMIKVREVMSSPVITHSPLDPLIEGMKTMISNDIRRLVLVKENRLEGIVTIKDVIRYFAQNDTQEKLRKGLYREVIRTPLQYLSKKEVIYIDPEADVGEALKKMRQHRIGALPVLEEENLVGIITERDLLIKVPKISGVEVFVNVAEKQIVAGRVFL